MNARMEALQSELSMISARRNEAEVGFRLETARQSERLTVLEPATLADYPATSARKKKAIIGGAASILIGLIIAFLLELRAPVLRTAAQMERETGLAPVASIPPLKVGRRGQTVVFAFGAATHDWEKITSFSFAGSLQGRLLWRGSVFRYCGVAT